MAKEDLGKLSTEQLNKLAKTISEAKDLTAQQEAIIGKVLAGEEDIGKLRISYLEEYFDIYSKNLDLVARKHSSLNDTFLILDEKLTNNYKALSSDIAKLEQRLADIAKFTSESKNTSSDADAPDSSGSNEEPKNGAKKNYSEQLDTIIRLLSEERRGGSGDGSGGSDSGNGGSSSGASASPSGDTTYNNIEATTRAMLEQKKVNDALSTINSPVQEIEVIDQAKALATKQISDLNDRADNIYSSIRELEIARLLRLEDTQLTEEQIAIKKEQLIIKQADLEIRTAEARLKKLQEVDAAEKATENFLSNIAIELAYASKAGQTNEYGYEYNEAGENRAKKAGAEDTLKTVQDLEAKRIKWIEKQELEAKRKNNGILSKEEATRIQKEAAKKFKFDEENLKKLNEQRIKLEGAKAHAAERAELRDGIKTMTSAETFEERKQALYDLTHDEAGDFDKGKALSAAMLAISDLAKKLENKIDEIGKYQGSIDTRLQGSSNRRYAFSYWGQLTRDMMSVGAITPYFKQEDFANNIKTLVDKGISFDLKQRAFLMTIQEKIATTFDVADGTLLRLIRLQQEDSTAGRLGMESALNSFLNEMYETSEYLTDVANNVRGSLEEMEALMTGAAATEVEYQVQKWMGSLYSVGMSQEAVTSIASTLGQIAAGQIDGLTGGNGTGNLLVMAANDAGIPIADILTDGLNADETNRLLQATVNYLAEIAESSKGNNVVQQQLAGVFGVKASDLRAATNLTSKSTTNDIFDESMSYGNMIRQLHKMAATMGLRTSAGEMMSNIWENGQYSIASSIAKSPLSYLTYKLAGLLDSAVGGIDLPFVNVMGFGVDLNTTVSDLMRVASVGAGLLGSLGPMINGLASSFSGNMMLATMGITQGSGLKVTPRGGDGVGTSESNGGNSGGGGQQTTSGSGYIGNSSSSDIKNSTIQESKDSKKQQMIEAKEEEPANQVNVLNAHVIKIYELLDDVARGNRTLRVKVDNYGLTGTNSSGAQGGVSGLLNSNNNSSSLGSSYDGSLSSGGGSGTSNSTSSNLGNNNSGLDSYGSSNSNNRNSVDLGGWTMF